MSAGATSEAPSTRIAPTRTRGPSMTGTAIRTSLWSSLQSRRGGLTAASENPLVCRYVPQGAYVGVQEIGAKERGKPTARPELHPLEELVGWNLSAPRDIEPDHGDAWPLVHRECDGAAATVRLLHRRCRPGKGVAELPIRALDGAGSRVERERIDGGQGDEIGASRQLPVAERRVALELHLYWGPSSTRSSMSTRLVAGSQAEGTAETRASRKSRSRMKRVAASAPSFTSRSR